jgi:hypothetical protein
MARIRTIKPEFFTSSDIVELTPLSRLFYISLWCEADREGRLNWNAKTLKMRYMPADDCNINEMAKELTDAKLLIIYEINGKTYAEIPSFTKHQVINNRESDSQIPPRVKVASARVLGEGRKGKEGREGASIKRETTIPQNFGISDNVKRWADEKGYSSLNAHLENFINVCIAKNYKYVDWDRAFMNAVSKNWAEIQKTEEPDWKKRML